MGRMKYTSFPGGGFPAHTGLENGRLNTRNEKERFDGGRGGFTRNKKRKREMLLRKFSSRVTGRHVLPISRFEVAQVQQQGQRAEAVPFKIASAFLALHRNTVSYTFKQT